MTRIAAIGLGLRTTAMLIELLKADPTLDLVAVADPRMDTAIDELASAGFPVTSEVRT
nr:hypothetical protein [Actinomycetota bacterium]